jgi:hypothetical protein
MARVVGAAVGEPTGHALDEAGVDLPRRDQARNSTHQRRS